MQLGWAKKVLVSMSKIATLSNTIKNMLYMWECRKKPLEVNKVVFRSFHGTKYSDSPKYISERLHELATKKGQSVDIVWIIDGNVTVPDYCRTVRQGTKEALKELSTSRVWVDNVRKDLWDRKRKNQFYIQTWHGGIALKKIEQDASSALAKTYIRRARRSHAPERSCR